MDDVHRVRSVREWREEVRLDGLHPARMVLLLLNWHKAARMPRVLRRARRAAVADEGQRRGGKARSC